MRAVCSLFTLTVIAMLVGCDPSDPSVVDASSQGVAAEGHDHAHDHGEHDHDHGEHSHDDHGHSEDGEPTTLSEAVEKLTEMSGKITIAFANGKPDEAHGDLHEIGHLIECLPGLAKKSELSSEDQGTVQETTEALMDAFGELDATLHGGDSVDVEGVTKEISTQMNKLQAVL